MGWLIGYTLASIAASFIVVQIFDKIVDSLTSGVTSGTVGIARFGLFVGTWTAVTAQAGMHGVNKRIRNLRKGIVKRILR